MLGSRVYITTGLGKNLRILEYEGSPLLLPSDKSDKPVTLITRDVWTFIKDKTSIKESVFDQATGKLPGGILISQEFITFQ